MDKEELKENIGENLTEDTELNTQSTENDNSAISELSAIGFFSSSSCHIFSLLYNH